MRYTFMGLEPLAFMRRFRVQITFRREGADPSPIDDCVAGPVHQTKEFPSGSRFKLGGVKATGNEAMVELLRGGTQESGVRYLPWQPDWCTYTRMDPAAEMVFTGPLTGCNIYVAGPRDAPVLFHTNSNANADDVAANNVAKRTMTLNLLAAQITGLPAATLIGGQLERATYSGSFLGFVFGLKEANDWKFWFNGIGAGSQVLKRIF